MTNDVLKYRIVESMEIGAEKTLQERGQNVDAIAVNKTVLLDEELLGRGHIQDGSEEANEKIKLFQLNFCRTEKRSTNSRWQSVSRNLGPC